MLQNSFSLSTSLRASRLKACWSRPKKCPKSAVPWANHLATFRSVGPGREGLSTSEADSTRLVSYIMCHLATKSELTEKCSSHGLQVNVMTTTAEYPSGREDTLNDSPNISADEKVLIIIDDKQFAPGCGDLI